MMEIVRALSEIERECIAPHLEAHRRFQRIVEAWAPEPGLKFDADSLTYLRDVPESRPPDGTTTDTLEDPCPE